MLLIFTANMHGMFQRRIINVLQSPAFHTADKNKNFFKKYLKCLIILLVKVVLVMMDHKTTIFQLFFKSFTTPTGSNRVSAWKCKGLSQESNKLSNTLGYSLAPKLTLIHHAKIAVKFEVSCLKQDKVF